jgi:hypothetical protein
MVDAKLIALLLSAVFLACSDRDVTPSSDPGPPVVQGLDPAELLSRGQYLADFVTGCSGCHTPRDAMGAPIAGEALAGAECFIRLDNGSCLNAPNITNHATGLLNRTDAEVRRTVTAFAPPWAVLPWGPRA